MKALIPATFGASSYDRPWWVIVDEKKEQKSAWELFGDKVEGTRSSYEESCFLGKSFKRASGRLLRDEGGGQSLWSNKRPLK